MVAVRSRLRAPASLLALTASYIARRPRAAVPAAQIALRVGVQVRNAPILRVDHGVLARADELAPVCSLVSDTHVVANGRSPCELEQDPEQWPWPVAPTREHLAEGVGRLLAHVRDHAPRTVVWCGDEVDSGDPAEWRQWRAAVDTVPELAHRVVPGNHDICFNRPFDEDYDLARRALPDEWYNTAVDADRLVRILQRYRRRAATNQVLVCHGHRHALAAGWIGDTDAPIALVGLPSSTLGDKADTGRLDGILRYGIAGLRSDGTWGVALREVGELIPSRARRDLAGRRR